MNHAHDIVCQWWPARIVNSLGEWTSSTFIGPQKVALILPAPFSFALGWPTKGVLRWNGSVHQTRNKDEQKTHSTKRKRWTT